MTVKENRDSKLKIMKILYVTPNHPSNQDIRDKSIY